MICATSAILEGAIGEMISDLFTFTLLLGKQVAILRSGDAGEYAVVQSKSRRPMFGASWVGFVLQSRRRDRENPVEESGVAWSRQVLFPKMH